MRVNAATIGAVTLGSSVMAQSPPAPGPVFSSELLDFQSFGNWTLDACHKIDTSFDGRIWPCASQLRTLVRLCPTFANTPEERIAQRDCLCGQGSSFLQDAVACSECKIQNGLQPGTQRDYWIKYYKAVDDQYCRATNVSTDFNTFRADLDKKMSIPQGGWNINQHDGKVVDPKTYYGNNVPEKQGAGKAAPAVVNTDKDAAVPPMNDNLAGQVTVPVFVVVPAAENKTETIKPTTSAPFQNGTATIKPTSLPSTFLTVTTSTSAGAPITTLLPSSSIVPAPGTVPSPVEEHIIVIAGKRCVVYICWVVVDCTPKTDAAGNFAIGYQTVGVDKKTPAVMLDNKEQFDKIKDTVPDAGKDQKLAEDVKQHIGTASPVVPAPGAPGKNKNLPPVKGSTGETKVPSGSQPGNDDECVEEVPQTQKGHNGGSDAVPVGQVSQPSTGKPDHGVPTKPGQGVSSKPNQNSGSDHSKPNQNSGSDHSKPNQGSVNVPSKDGQKPSSSDNSKPNQGSVSVPSNSGSTPSNTGSNTCECECPSTLAAATSSDRDSTEICNKKSETQANCQKLSGRKVWECLCAKGEFWEKTDFFKEAVQCARRTGEVRQSEFEAQIFFEVNARYCQKELFGNDFDAAYTNVTNEWRESRTPSALM